MKVDYNKRREEQKSSHSLHPSVRFRNKFIIGKLKNIQFKTLVDVGCGDGYLLSIIKNNFPSAKYSGLDISDLIIEENKEKYGEISFYKGDIGNTIFDLKDKYDVVICSEVIEHIENRKQVIHNLSDMVESDGYCILTTQSGKRYKSDINIGHLKHFKLEELEKEFKNNGFDIVCSYKRGFPFYNMQKWLYEKIENKAKEIQHSKVTFLSKLLFDITYILFLISIKSKILGPQIFMVLQKK